MGPKACYILSWWLPSKKCCRSPVTQGGSAALSVPCLLWNRSTAGAGLQFPDDFLQPPVMKVIKACGWDMGTLSSKLALPAWRCLSPQISSVASPSIRSFGFLLRKAFLIFVLQLVGPQREQELGPSRLSYKSQMPSCWCSYFSMMWKVGKIENVHIEVLGSSIHLQKEGGRRGVSKGK